METGELIAKIICYCLYFGIPILLLIAGIRQEIKDFKKYKQKN